MCKHVDTYCQIKYLKRHGFCSSIKYVKSFATRMPQIAGLHMKIDETIRIKCPF